MRTQPLLPTALPAQVPRLFHRQRRNPTHPIEARFVKRLFVPDNSPLANGLGGPNPTLTTQALATRTAEKIFTRYFGGRSWVNRESPVSSIDPSVTRALVACGHAGH